MVCNVTQEDLQQFTRDQLVDEVLTRHHQLQKSESQLQKSEAKIQHHEAKIHDLSSQVAWLTKQLFGRKSERFASDTGPTLFGDEAVDDASSSIAVVDTQTMTRQKPQRGKRPNLAEADLPEEVIVCEPQDLDLTQYKRIGEQVSYHLELEPGKLYKVKVIRPKYVPIEGEGSVLIADPYALPIDKGIAGIRGPGLLAMVMLNKFADHLPMYRQEKQFARMKHYVADSSMCRWAQQLGELCHPLLKLFKERICQSHVIQVDETPIRQKDRKSKAYFWSYCGDASNPYVLYDYQSGRGRAGPNGWFAKGADGSLFSGYLQCDGYAGYNDLWQSPYEMVHVACWAHVRRKFHDQSQRHYARAKEALKQISKLYDVEREAREQSLSHQERLAMRVSESSPIVETFFNWCRQSMSELKRPTDEIRKACEYALNFETSLKQYLADGQLAIDNNACERTMRGIALGRKNWLFQGSEQGGRASAAMFSLIASCQRSRINEWAYLKDLFTRLPATPTRERELEAFLPDRWKLEHPEA